MDARRWCAHERIGHVGRGEHEDAVGVVEALDYQRVGAATHEKCGKKGANSVVRITIGGLHDDES